MSGLLKVDNIMYKVADLASAQDFYISHFGVTKVWEDSEQRMVGLKLRDSDGEIVLHSNPDLPSFDYSFLVDDVKRLCADFSTAGGNVETQPICVRTGWYAVLGDEDGNTIPIIDLSRFGGKPRYGDSATMRRQRINPPALYQAVPYDYASVTPGGSTVFTAGACPLDDQGNVVAPGDLEAQAGKAIGNLMLVLTEAGSSAERVVKTTVYVVARDRSELVRVWSVVEERFGAARPPSTLLGVSVLGYPDQLVEIEAVALRSPD